MVGGCGVGWGYGCGVGGSAGGWVYIFGGLVWFGLGSGGVTGKELV